MRALYFIIGVAVWLVAGRSEAAVIQLPGRIEVEAVIDGSSGNPGLEGDTMDYLTFEVLSMGSVTVATGSSRALRLQLARYIGVDDEFGFLGNPYRLEGPSMFTRVLDPGIYVTAMGVREHTSYDVFDGYDPVNEEGGGFTFGNYSYSIEGPVRALEFREGNLDGTFTITRIPEPAAPILLAAAAALALARRRRMGNRHMAAILVIAAVSITPGKADAATHLLFRGKFEVSGGPAPIQTLDWHVFRVAGGNARISVGALVEAGNARTAWMIIGGYDGSEFLTDIEIIEAECGEASCFNREATLEDGMWAVGFAPAIVERDSSYIGDATWPEFQRNWGGYVLSISAIGPGSVDWLQHREGNLDGTFTITRIPEPTMPILLAAAAVAVLARRGRST